MYTLANFENQKALQTAFLVGCRQNSGNQDLHVLEETNYDVIFLICFKPNSKTEYNINIEQLIYHSSKY